MKASSIYGPCSAPTAGGSPATDKEFMAWAAEAAESGNARILDACSPDHLPDRDPLPIWRLINHLLKTCGAGGVDVEHLNYNHRIRRMAVRYLDRPDIIEAEAESYIARLASEARSEGRS